MASTLRRSDRRPRDTAPAGAPSRTSSRRADTATNFFQILREVGPCSRASLSVDHLTDVVGSA
jgi:hypothetical protein